MHVDFDRAITRDGDGALERLRAVIRVALVLLLSSLAASGSRAQLYDAWHRPIDVAYFEARSPHFRIFYQAGLSREARELAGLLEEELPAVEAVVGLRRPLHVPVVINQFTDRGNGFVTPMPFRQEFEAVALRGNTLSPRFSSWFEAVGPHELVHAVHAESGRGFGVGWMLRLFGKDLARSLNLSGPRGINEGAAVWYESSRVPGAGRLGHSLFKMEFRAAMLSDDPWSLAQMLEPPSYTRPFDRYYNGGAHLFAYMADRDGDVDFFKRARTFYYRFPLLGYGPALWYGTRTAPHALGRRLHSYYRDEAVWSLPTEKELTEPDVIASKRGTVHRRPVWIDRETVVVHASGYHRRPGFYAIDVSSGNMEALAYESITEDFQFQLARDSSSIVFSRYVPDRLEAIRLRSDVFRIDLADGEVIRLTRGGRVFAPVEASGGRTWAIRSAPQFNEWADVSEEGAVMSVAAFDRTALKSIHPSPVGERTMVLANNEGRQGIFEVADGEDRAELVPVVVFRDASVFDLSWGPKGEYVLFSADPGGIANIFSWEAVSGEVHQLTNVRFGAIEPSLSPDRSTLAFVNYRHERYDLVRMPFSMPVPGRNTATSIVPPEKFVSTSTLRPTSASASVRASPPVQGQDRIDDSIRTTDERYRPILEIRPRVFYPFLLYQRPTGDEEDVHLGFGAGAGVEWSDPLQYWTAHTSAYYQRGTVWGRLLVRSGRFLLRSSAEVFRDPSTVVVRRNQQGRIDTVRVGRDERGIGLGLTLPAVLEANVFRTTVRSTLNGEYRTERLFDVDGPIGETDDLITLRPSFRLDYRIQTNVRDIVPNSGLRVSTLARVDVWSRRSRASRYARTRGELFLPFLRQTSTGLALNGTIHAQNRGGIADLSEVFPRGYETETVFLASGTYGKAGVEVTQPLWYIDDGFVLLPFFFRALFAYGFVESMQPIAGSARVLTVAGGGLGVEARFAYGINVTLRAAPVYRFHERDWAMTFR